MRTIFVKIGLLTICLSFVLISFGCGGGHHEPEHTDIVVIDEPTYCGTEISYGGRLVLENSDGLICYDASYIGKIGVGPKYTNTNNTFYFTDGRLFSPESLEVGLDYLLTNTIELTLQTSTTNALVSIVFYYDGHRFNAEGSIDGVPDDSFFEFRRPNRNDIVIIQLFFPAIYYYDFEDINYLNIVTHTRRVIFGGISVHQ